MRQRTGPTIPVVGLEIQDGMAHMTIDPHTVEVAAADTAIEEIAAPEASPGATASQFDLGNPEDTAIGIGQVETAIVIAAVVGKMITAVGRGITTATHMMIHVANADTNTSRREWFSGWVPSIS